MKTTKTGRKVTRKVTKKATKATKKVAKKSPKKSKGSFFDSVRRFFSGGDDDMQTKKGKKEDGCVRQTTKKYTSRPSPPYPANQCPKKEHEGNDGNTWVSKRASNGVYRWVLKK